MSLIFRLFRLAIRLAAWATPHVKEWHRGRHMNHEEAKRHLDARNWTEAEKHFTLALGERRRSAKQRHELLLGLARAQRGQRKFAESEESLREAGSLAGRDHSMYVQALEELIELELEQSKYGEAQKTIEEIVRRESAQPQPAHARLAQCSRKLGMALVHSDRRAEALQAFERAVKLSEKAFGADHVETANGLAELGVLHREKGDHAEAQHCLRRALRIHRAVSGADSHQAAQDLHHLAESLEESGDLDGAASEYERVLALRARQVGADRGQTAGAQVRLAILYLQAERIAQARELLTQAIPVLERQPGGQYALAVEALARAEEQAGRPEEAKRWREKASSLAPNLARA
jgi:tetratricopeptide (TPR) repeat protein